MVTRQARSRHPRRLRRVLLPLAAALAGALAACTPGSQGQAIATALADDDHDGWFTDTSNVAVSLVITSVRFTQTGDYQFIVDETHFPLNQTLDGQFSISGTQTAPESLFTGNMVVATRTRGVEGLGAGGTPFSATVRLVKMLGIAGPQVMGAATVRFGETAGTLAPVTFDGGLLLGEARIQMAVSRTTFRDPTPNDSTGDVDMDGITEVAEARLSHHFGGIFDPRSNGRDIDLIVGGTAPNFALDSSERLTLTSRFRVNGIALHLDDGMLGGVTGAGGAMNLAGTGATSTGTVTLAQAAAVRNANVGPGRRRFAHFALLAGNASDGTMAAFGFSTQPGNVLVMRNGPIPNGGAGATFDWYRMGVFMHELGHSLGLCHPTESDGVNPSCPASMVIPLAERDPGATVMGSPAENAGNVGNQAINALKRPLDYTTTQWQKIRVGAGLAP